MLSQWGIGSGECFLFGVMELEDPPKLVRIHLEGTLGWADQNNNNPGIKNIIQSDPKEKMGRKIFIWNLNGWFEETKEHRVVSLTLVVVFLHHSNYL